MGHFTIHVNGQRVGSVLALSNKEYYVCFNRRFPYRDCWGKSEAVKKNLRQQIPTAIFKPLDLPKLDAWLHDLDQQYEAMQCGNNEDK